MLRRLWHGLAHLTGWDLCEIVSGTDERDYWVGGRCVTCGKVHPATKWYPEGRV